MIYILAILFIHWIADFVLQTDTMAKNKSTSNYYLTIHVLTYTTALGLGALFLPFKDFDLLLLWMGFNGVLHWITDYFTSRLNTYLWKKQDVHNFFVSVGFDQFIHYTCLLLSYQLINKL